MLPKKEIVKLRLKRNVPVLFGISLASTLFALVWWQLDVLGIHGQELGAYDTGLETFTGKDWFPPGRKPVSKDIVIVAIDDTVPEGDYDLRVRSFVDLAGNAGLPVDLHLFSVDNTAPVPSAAPEP